MPVISTCADPKMTQETSPVSHDRPSRLGRLVVISMLMLIAFGLSFFVG
jgi:hypothetical protein